MPQRTHILIAVDIGNSRIKLGLFERGVDSAELPVPLETLELPLAHPAGEFEEKSLARWCETCIAGDALWRISSVHRGATERFIAAAAAAKLAGHEWTLRQIAHREVPMTAEVDYPDRVGMDRLLAALAANRLRVPDRAAVVVDLGTAIKVDMVTAGGAFAGGAILPGLAMSARALKEQTDALPHIEVDHWREPPYPIGKSTVPAIESGLFWGAVGAIRELSVRYAAQLPTPPDFFITGGSAPLVARVLASTSGFPVRHLPHLVLSGIALVDQAYKNGK